VKLMHDAVDRGITFFDNCWDYNSGLSESRMGQALQAPGYRDKVFLMTKIDGRSSTGFATQLDQSLHRLLVDHIDLIQFHEIIRPEDVDRIFAADGAIHAALAAQKAGKVRFIGFTGHKNPSIHLHMIETATRHEFTFDTVQMPLNVMDAHYESFEKRVLPVAKKLDMGIIAMKTFGDHFILDSKAVSPRDMLHYGMNLPTSVVVTGIDKPQILDQAIEAASSFAPLAAAKVRAILAKSKPHARDGKCELYKSTHFFDATMQNPTWLD
jgi:aryl-alcohol dehydrogenase-like predicted oxidoreductase